VFTSSLVMAGVLDGAASKTLSISRISIAQLSAEKRKSWKSAWLLLASSPKGKVHVPPL